MGQQIEQQYTTARLATFNLSPLSTKRLWPLSLISRYLKRVLMTWVAQAKEETPKRIGSARTSLSSLLHARSTISDIKTWEIASSSGS